ncbi:MAG: hypothetical protein AAGA15_16655 [Pseudomonadota bacterium]
MSYYVSRPFGRRIDRLERKHRKMARGVVPVVRSDGLMVLQPRRGGLRRVVRFMFLALVCLLAFKTVVYQAEGPITYQSRIDRLAAGTGPEAMAAQLMEIDPVTQFVIEQAGPALDRAGQVWREYRPILEANFWANPT